MKKYLILIILLLLPLKVEATCDTAEKVRLNKLAANVSFTYTYVEKDNNVTFNVTITNLTKDLVLYDKYNDFEYNVDNEITIKDYRPNSDARYYIYAKDDSCISSPIGNYAITFPNYNPYYKDELCSKAIDYLYCHRWINMPYSYEEFKKNVSKYIETNKEVESDEEEMPKETNNSLLNALGTIYVKFYYIILPIIIISCLLEIHYLNQKNKLV